MNALLRLLTWPFVRFPRWVGNMFVCVLRRVMANGVTGTASQFAYNAFLATIPFLFVLVTAIRLSGPDSYTNIFDRLEETIPGISGLAPAFRSAVASGAAAGVVILIGSVAGLYVSSNAIGALVDGLDRAQRLPHRRWIRAKVYNMVLAAGTILLALVGVLSLGGGERLVRGIIDLLGGGSSVRSLADQVTLPLGLFLIFVFTLLLYRFGPNEMRLGFRAILPGALLSTAGWYGTTALVGLYATVFHNLTSVYGTLGAIFVYLTFLYLSGLVILIGAELNAELVHRRLQRQARAATSATAAPHAAPPPGDDVAPTATMPAAPVGAGAAEPTREIEWP